MRVRILHMGEMGSGLEVGNKGTGFEQLSTFSASRARFIGFGIPTQIFFRVTLNAVQSDTGDDVALPILEARREHVEPGFLSVDMCRDANTSKPLGLGD